MKTESTSKERPAPNKDKAEFKMLVYFKDGNARTFYNYHTAYNAESKRVTIDHKVALNKLIRLLQFKYYGKYKGAVIYHIPTNKQLYKYVNDKLIADAAFNFVAQGFNTIINFNV